MPVERITLDALYGRSVDLVTADGAALVAQLGATHEENGGPEVWIAVLAVERPGSVRAWSPGDHDTLRLDQIRSVRPVVYLSGSGM
jgi:hypothetical protein